MEAVEKGLTVPNVNEWLMKASAKHRQMGEAVRSRGGMPNETGAQGQDQNQLAAGQAPQQGGESAERTTSRELAEGGGPGQGVPPEGVEAGGGGGGGAQA